MTKNEFVDQVAANCGLGRGEAGNPAFEVCQQRRIRTDAHVAVDEAWRDDLAADIDQASGARLAEIFDPAGRADLFDASILDQQRAIADEAQIRTG